MKKHVIVEIKSNPEHSFDGVKVFDPVSFTHYELKDFLSLPPGKHLVRLSVTLEVLESIPELASRAKTPLSEEDLATLKSVSESLGWAIPDTELTC